MSRGSAHRSAELAPLRPDPCARGDVTAATSMSPPLASRSRGFTPADARGVSAFSRAGACGRSANARGFSLLEVLVALALFAIAMGLAYGGLDAVVRARAQHDNGERDERPGRGTHG